MKPARRFAAAVLLAGGKSQRMGSEKACLELDGETFLERQLRQLAGWFDWLAVSVGHQGPSPALAQALARASQVLGRPLEIVHDQLDGQGPLAGVAAALARLPAQRAFFVAVDMPQVDFELVAALWKASTEGASRGAVPCWARGLEPAQAVYARSLLESAQGLLARGERSLQALARQPGVVTLDLEVAATQARVFGARPVDLAALFATLNTPTELAAWRARRGKQ